MASRSKATNLSAPAAIAMAVGLIGVGALSVFYRDFALVWQPVPASWPHHEALALGSGLILAGAGVMLLFRRTRAWGAALAAVFLLSWVLFLHLPKALTHPLIVANWQAVCESLAMATGAFIAARDGKGGAGRGAVLVMGVCFVVFGLSHFVYAKFTTAMVPPFLPYRLQLTYLTGAIHALTGLVILAGVRPRWAAFAEGALMTSFVLLVHIPRVAAAPQDRMELTSLFIAITLSSAAWILATSKAIGTR